MKNKFFLIAVLFVGITVFFTACKDDDIPQKNTKEIIDEKYPIPDPVRWADFTKEMNRTDSARKAAVQKVRDLN